MPCRPRPPVNASNVANFVGLALVFAVAGCRAANVPPAAVVAERPVTTPADRTLPLRVPFAPDPENEPGFMSLLEHEYLARAWNAVFLERPDGTYAPAYIHPRDETAPVYVFEEMRAPFDKLPFGPISNATSATEADLEGRKVVPIRVHPRYVTMPGGKAAVGLYEPAYRHFYRWRGIVRDAETVDLDPSSGPIASEILPDRIISTIDVDPPADEAYREVY